MEQLEGLMKQKLKCKHHFFSGKVKAMCMQKPIYDLIIGNIPGVRGTEVIGNNKEGAKPHKEKERQGVSKIN